MDEADLKKIVTRVLRALGCAHYSFQKPASGHAGVSVVFSLREEDALRAYQDFGNINFYGTGWLMRPMETDREKFKVDFEKV